MKSTGASVLLYQFPVSHYCEKVRWQLDVKGIGYRAVNLFPGLHSRFTNKIAATRSLPILKDKSRVIADSTRIALYLEDAYSALPLLPRDEPGRRKVLAVEGLCDELGDEVRRWVYGQLLSHPQLGRMMFQAYPLAPRLFGRALTPLLRLGLRKLYRVYPNKVQQAEERMWAGLDRLAGEMGGRTQGYLVGDRLSLADIAAAAMYGPLLRPPGSPWMDSEVMTPKLAEAMSRARAHPAGQWLMWLYANARQGKTRGA